MHISGLSRNLVNKKLHKTCTSIKISVVGRTATAFGVVSVRCVHLAGDKLLFFILSCTTLTCMSFKKTIGGVRISCFCIFNTIIVNIGYIFVQM